MRETQELTREARQQAGRELTWFHDDDGSLVIRARLPAEAGAIFLKALAAAEDSFPIPDVSAETFLDPVQPRQALRADALVRISESFLASDPQDLSGGDRQQIVMHVDAETLKHDHAGRCELEHGPALAAETVRRLACDASLVTIIENGQGEPLNVGRKTRTIPPAIKRALNSRDQGCRFPGCSFTRYVDGHHVHHWAQGGETKLSNLVTLCRFHHRQVHEGKVVVHILDDGAFRSTRPDGRSFDSPAPQAIDWTGLVANQQILIAPQIAVTRWTGEAFDEAQAVDWLLQRAARTKNVSAETSPAGYDISRAVHPSTSVTRGPKVSPFLKIYFP